jgi:hypothetical protein
VYQTRGPSILGQDPNRRAIPAQALSKLQSLKATIFFEILWLAWNCFFFFKQYEKGCSVISAMVVTRRAAVIERN